jgi:flagellar basal body rod protein FlgB
MSWISDPGIRALSGALDGLGARTQAIASNLSNIDTPGYVPVRIDFETALAAELQAAGLAVTDDGSAAWSGGVAGTPASSAAGSAALRRTDSRHFSSGGGAGSEAGPATEPYLANTRNDANAVDIDESMSGLVETQLKYGATSRLLTGQLGMLRDVITSQGGR